MEETRLADKIRCSTLQRRFCRRRAAASRYGGTKQDSHHVTWIWRRAPLPLARPSFVDPGHAERFSDGFASLAGRLAPHHPPLHLHKMPKQRSGRGILLVSNLPQLQNLIKVSESLHIPSSPSAVTSAEPCLVPSSATQRATEKSSSRSTTNTPLFYDSSRSLPPHPRRRPTRISRTTVSRSS